MAASATDQERNGNGAAANAIERVAFASGNLVRAMQSISCRRPTQRCARRASARRRPCSTVRVSAFRGECRRANARRAFSTATTLRRLRALALAILQDEQDQSARAAIAAALTDNNGGEMGIRIVTGVPNDQVEGFCVLQRAFGATVCEPTRKNGTLRRPCRFSGPGIAVHGQCQPHPAMTATASRASSPMRLRLGCALRPAARKTASWPVGTSRCAARLCRLRSSVDETTRRRAGGPAAD